MGAGGVVGDPAIWTTAPMAGDGWDAWDAMKGSVVR